MNVKEKRAVRETREGNEKRGKAKNQYIGLKHLHGREICIGITIHLNIESGEAVAIGELHSLSRSYGI